MKTLSRLMPAPADLPALPMLAPFRVDGIEAAPGRSWRRRGKDSSPTTSAGPS